MKKTQRAFLALCLAAALLVQGTYPYALYAEVSAASSTPATVEEPGQAAEEAAEEPAAVETGEARTEDLEAALEIEQAASSTEEQAADLSATTTASSTDSADRDLSTTTAATASSTESSITGAEALVPSTTTPTTTENASSTSPAATTSQASVSTGRAVALANVLNIVNTNFVNSSGVVFFSNFFEYLAESLDLRDLFGGSACGSSPCAVGGDVLVNATNTAKVDNSILLQAVTGGNKIEGDGTIETGDAYAGLNLINLANNSFVDSNYLLVTVNGFAGGEGDIVFPSLSRFLGSGNGSVPGTLVNDSAATVANNVSAVTDSGGNRTDAASSTIATGEAKSETNVFNQLNSNLAGGGRLSILFKVHGDWAGEVFGAPEGVSWLEGPDGSLFLFDSVPGTASTSGTEINVSNDAAITNDVSIVALTGDNRISGADTAMISTGNAYAGANIVNVANSTVVGKNWILAIINIFGDFKGNIAFGRPDLWVGEQIETPDRVVEGAELLYRFTVINNGDSVSTETRLVDRYDREHLEIIESSLPHEATEDGLAWNLGTLEAGQAAEVTYRAKIINAGPGTDITNTVAVQGRETDDNTEDNTDTATVSTEKERSSPKKRLPRLLAEPEEETAEPATTTVASLEVSRTRLTTVVDRNNPLSPQEITVMNPTGQSVPGVIVRDILRDPQGTVIKTEIWDLGEVLPNEEIVLSYDLSFSQEAEAGFYSLETVVAADQDKRSFRPNGFIIVRDLAVLAVPAVALAGPSVAAEAGDAPEAPATILTPERAHAADSDFVASPAGQGKALPLLLIPLAAIILTYGAIRFLLLARGE